MMGVVIIIMNLHLLHDAALQHRVGLQHHDILLLLLVLQCPRHGRLVFLHFRLHRLQLLYLVLQLAVLHLLRLQHS